MFKSLFAFEEAGGEKAPTRHCWPKSAFPFAARPLANALDAMPPPVDEIFARLNIGLDVPSACGRGLLAGESDTLVQVRVLG